MTPIAEDVYDALEDAAQNEQEEEQIENARAKHLVKERYNESKTATYVATAGTILPVIALWYNDTYTTPEITAAAIIIIGAWMYCNHYRTLLNEARIDYYCGTDVIDEVKE